MVTMWKGSKHCRWCGKHYNAAQPHGKDGFCCPGHKQAHHRAYRKYVTSKTSNVDICRPDAVTRKKRKKGRKVKQQDTGGSRTATARRAAGAMY